VNDFLLYVCPTCKTIYETSAIVFDRRPRRFARAASRIFRSPKMASGSRSGEPALDSMQHSVTCSPLPPPWSVEQHAVALARYRAQLDTPPFERQRNDGLAPPLTYEIDSADVVPVVDCCCGIGLPVGPWITP
jgi:hypothetical protein